MYNRQIVKSQIDYLNSKICFRCNKSKTLILKEDPSFGGEEVYCTYCKKFNR